jgi:hypothetical protein
VGSRIPRDRLDGVRRVCRAPRDIAIDQSAMIVLRNAAPPSGSFSPDRIGRVMCRAMLRADIRVLPAAERAAAAVMECEQRRIARR